MRDAFIISLILASSGAAQAQGDAAKGETLFKQCAPCHPVGPGAKSGGAGPQLNAIIGRASASLSDYTYSPQMRSARLTWNAPELSRFLKAPKSLVPGTRMLFNGLPSDEDAAHVIAFLAQFDAAGEKK